jgi:predicted Zn-dependent protease
MTQSRIDAFTSMLKDQPDNEMIWYGLANEYMKLENWPAAVDALRNVIRIKPDYTSAYQMLGAALSSRKGVKRRGACGRKGLRRPTARARGRRGNIWKHCSPD